MSRKSSVHIGVINTSTLATILPDMTNSPDMPRPANKGRSFESIRLAREQAEIDGFEKGYQQGHADGYARGIREGRETGRTDVFRESAEERKQALEEFVGALDQVQRWLQEAIGEWFEASEEKMTDRAMAAVQEILATELTLSRESALNIVKQALAEVTHSRHARIRLNPFDGAILQNHRTELLAASGSLRDIELVDDPTIVGGCVIETEGGLVDATTETRLELLSTTLEEAA